MGNCGLSLHFWHSWDEESYTFLVQLRHLKTELKKTHVTNTPLCLMEHILFFDVPVYARNTHFILSLKSLPCRAYLAGWVCSGTDNTTWRTCCVYCLRSYWCRDYTMFCQSGYHSCVLWSSQSLELRNTKISFIKWRKYEDQYQLSRLETRYRTLSCFFLLVVYCGTKWLCVCTHTHIHACVCTCVLATYWLPKYSFF